VVVPARDTEKLVLVYPSDEQITDSEVTKKLVKEALAPKEQGIQIRALRKVQRGGVAIESGTTQSAKKIRDMADKHDRLKIALPKKILPKVMIYDVAKELRDADIVDYVYQQKPG
jgi:hypothetical protein